MDRLNGDDDLVEPWYPCGFIDHRQHLGSTDMCGCGKEACCLRMVEDEARVKGAGHSVRAVERSFVGVGEPTARIWDW
jgi:hypothetical protein